MTEALVINDVVLDVTLVPFEGMFYGNDSAIVAADDLDYAPPSLLANWRSGMTFSREWSEADFDSAQALWSTVLRFTKHLYESGVRMVVGTDVPNPWVAPGTSFHREMRLLTDAGIPTSAVLRMATLGGAEAMGLAHDIGSIAEGKRADLVLLAADPTVDIENSRRIELVVVGGRPLRPRDLLPPRLQAASVGAQAALDSARRVAVTGRFQYWTVTERTGPAVAPGDALRGVWTALVAREGNRWAIVHEHESFATPLVSRAPPR